LKKLHYQRLCYNPNKREKLFIRLSKLVFAGVVLSTILQIDGVLKTSALLFGISATNYFCFNWVLINKRKLKEAFILFY
jgi:hypothetical protein